MAFLSIQGFDECYIQVGFKGAAKSAPYFVGSAALIVWSYQNPIDPLVHQRKQEKDFGRVIEFKKFWRILESILVGLLFSLFFIFFGLLAGIKQVRKQL